jgi:hypothetical protein
MHVEYENAHTEPAHHPRRHAVGCEVQPLSVMAHTLRRKQRRAVNSTVEEGLLPFNEG